MEDKGKGIGILRKKDKQKRLKREHRKRIVSLVAALGLSRSRHKGLPFER